MSRKCRKMLVLIKAETHNCGYKIRKLLNGVQVSFGIQDKRTFNWLTVIQG